MEKNKFLLKLELDTEEGLGKAFLDMKEESGINSNREFLRTLIASAYARWRKTHDR